MKIWSLGVVLTIQSVSIVGTILMTASPGLTANVWQDLWQRILRSPSQQPPRSVRGGNCLVSPSGVIWSDRPRLAWDNGLSPVKTVKIAKLDDVAHPVWSKEVDSKQTSIQYDGKPLPLGVYQWSTIDAFGGSRISVFEVMEQVERKEIGDALFVLEQEVKDQKLTDDDRIYKRIDFWLDTDRDLPWDAISETYADETRSSEVKTLRQKFVNRVCRLEPVPPKK